MIKNKLIFKRVWLFCCWKISEL